MNCETYSNQISDLIENKLDEQSAEQITLHLISCQSCESKFETLFYREEIYGNFLFGIEPPADLSEKFQSKLEAEDLQTATSKANFGFWERLSELFTFLRMNPVLTMAATIILLIISLGLFNFVGNENIGRQNESAQQKMEVTPLLPGIEKTAPKAAPPSVTFSGKSKAAEKEIEKEVSEIISIEKTEVKLKRQIAAKTIKLNAEEENQFAQSQSLEIDSARQIEKVEMLFRSFRNSRSTEETGQYDVDYERQQARKLLRNNVQLKKRAESYGSLLTEEMLNKVEPYLLDIANLDSNPSAEQVSEIKARFRNQNIIASLQGF